MVTRREVLLTLARRRIDEGKLDDAVASHHAVLEPGAFGKIVTSLVNNVILPPWPRVETPPDAPARTLVIAAVVVNVVASLAPIASGIAIDALLGHAESRLVVYHGFFALAGVTELVSTVERVRGIPFGGTEGDPLRLDVYRPRGAAGPLPVLLYVHGGGWTIGSRRLSSADSGSITRKSLRR